MKPYVFLFAVVWALSLGCTSGTISKGDQKASAFVFQPEEIFLETTGNPYFVRNDRLYFTDSFASEDTDELKGFGVKTVLFLVEDAELAPEIVDFVESQGIQLISMDFQWDGKRARDLLVKIEDVFMKHHRQETMVVASSNMDVVRTWLAYHLLVAHRISKDEALEYSERLGPYTSEDQKNLAAGLLPR